MRIIFLVLVSIGLLNATQTEVVHSSASLYLESKDFTSSVQKYDGYVAGVGADIHYKDSAFKASYEYGFTYTKQPPLKENLKVDKIFTKYMYKLNKEFAFNLNYINILHDNIAITDGGVAYGVGLSYKRLDKYFSNFTQYYTVYDDFNVAQSDLKLEYKFKVDSVGFRVSSITKYIFIDEKKANKFTKNAKSNYLTTGLKLHMHYATWHAGVGAYFGKRAFAIMNDGFKIQHHAMEFDRTYAVGVGKDIDSFVVRAQYIYQRAKELPKQNENVKVSNIRLITNYKF